MDENVRGDFLRRVGSLPPHVIGKINGYLSLTIDEIKWKILPCDVDVYVSWWGDKPQELSVPQVAQMCGSLETTYIYRITTNTELFVSYLQDCEELSFEIYERSTRTHLGTATLNNLLSIILYNPFKSTNVITDKNGTEIADIKISFVFLNHILMPRELGNVETMIYNILEKIQNIDLKKEGRARISEKSCFNDCDVLEVRPEFLNLKALEKNIFNLNKNDDIVSNSSISELLDQSHSIRQEYYNNAELDVLQSELKTGKEHTTTEAKIRDYLSGKNLSTEEECVALEAVKFRSEQELLELAEDCSSEFEKNVSTGQLICSKSNQGKQNLWPSMSSSQRQTKHRNKFGKQIKDSQNEKKKNGMILDHKSGSVYYSREKDSSASCFRYIQLTIQTLSLNYVGMQRVLVSSRALTSSTQARSSAHCCQLPPNVVFFVEYEIPKFLRYRSSESQNASKPWNSNLNRICSRKRTGKSIHFHREMIHMLASYKPKFREFLSNSSITFKVYSRHLNQRLPYLLGETSLSLEKVVKSCTNSFQELKILPQSFCNSNHMLSLGNLKVKIEFGSSRTSFGLKEVCSVAAQSLSSSESEYENEDLDTVSSKMISKCSKIISKPLKGKLDHRKNNSTDVNVGRNISSKTFQKGKLEPNCIISKNLSDKNESILLLGLLHVSLGREIKASGSYLVSHGFWKEDVMSSDIQWETENPIFKFHKIMPVLLTLELLDRCYNNYMVIEVWSQSSLVGIAKLPLNQFYIAYRDPPVVEQLLSSKYPIISADGWVDVVDPVTQFRVGQLNVILALGTEKQIQMLEMSRCLKEDINSQANLKSFSNCVISQSKPPSNNPNENQQILKLRSRRFSRNEIDLHYNEEVCDDKSIHNMEVDKAIPRQGLFGSYDCSEHYLKKSFRNTYEEVDSSRVSQSFQNMNVLEDESLAVDLSESPVRSGCIPNVSARTLVNQEVDLHGDQFDPKVSDGNTIQRNNHLVDKRTISQTHVKYLEKIDTERNLKINSLKNSDQKLSPLLNIAARTFEESDDFLVHEENHYLPKNDDISSGAVVNIESSVFGTSRSNFLPCTSHDSNSEEHSIVVHKSVQFGSDVSENGRKCLKNCNDFVSRMRKVQERLPCSSNLTLADLDSEEIHDSEYQVSKDENVYESIKSNDNSSITAVAENASTQTDILPQENFFAMVEIINGLYISKLDSGELPNCYVTFHIANNLIMTTSVINENIDPVWNWSSEVWLPVSLLENNGSCLIFKVCHKDDRSEQSVCVQNLVIGYVGIDLRVLVCGLPSISGWFNISDLSGNCKGQIQINITPLENVSQMRSILEPKYKMNKKKCVEKDSVYQVRMPNILHTDFEQCDKTIHGKVYSEGNKESFIPQKVKEFVNNTLQNKERDTCPNNKENYFLCENLLQSCDANKKSSINHDSSPLKFYKIPYSSMNQTCFENHSGNQKSDSQDNGALMVSDSKVVTYSNINCPTNTHHNCNGSHVSALTKTLRQKLQELDEIIQQMQIKSKCRNTKLQTKSSENTVINKSISNNEFCRELLDCGNESVNVSQRTLEPTNSEEVINRSTEKCMSNVSSFSYTKRVIEKERTKTQVSEAGTQLVQQCQDTGSLAMVSPLRIESDPRNSEVRCDALETEIAENVILSDLMTDHLMSEALREMDLESIFNPLLFQHIIANHQSQNRPLQWCNESRENPFLFHKTNKTTSFPSKAKRSCIWKAHNNTEILADIADNSACECSKMEDSQINGDYAKELFSCDSSPVISDEVIIKSRGDQIDNETFQSARQSCTYEHPSSSDYMKLQNSSMYKNYPKTNGNSTQNNFIEKFKLSDVAFLNDKKHLLQNDTSLIDKMSFKGPCIDKKILNTTENDKSNNMESFASCSYELEIKEALVQPETISVTSLNKTVMSDSSEKSMLGDFKSDKSVTKFGSNSSSENDGIRKKV